MYSIHFLKMEVLEKGTETRTLQFLTELLNLFHLYISIKYYVYISKYNSHTTQT